MAGEKRRVTLADVAGVAGVSPMTVSRVLRNSKGEFSEATRFRVEQAVRDLGYVPSRVARSLVTNKTYTVGVVVQDIANPYFAEFVRGAEDVLWENEYHILLCNAMETRQREVAVIGLLAEAAVDGLIVCGARLDDETLFPLLRRHPRVVSVNHLIPDDIGANLIDPQPSRVVEAVAFLAERGRRHIAYLNLNRPSAGDLHERYRRSLDRAGLPYDPALVVEVYPMWDAGYAVGKRLLAEGSQIDALIGGNDLVALGAMRAALDLGRCVPDDVAIIGGDDILMASQVTPALTTFRIDSCGLGRTSAGMLLALIQGDTRRTYVEYTHTLIVREST